MGRLFQALANLWRGIVTGLTRDIGSANPEATIEGAIQNRKEQRQKLVDRAKRLRVILRGVQSKLTLQRVELKKVEGAIQKAIATGNRSTGAVLLRRKEVLGTEIAGLVRQEEQLAEADRDVTADIDQFGRDIIATQHKLTVTAARAAAARVTQDILAEVSGLSVRGDDQAVQAAFEAMEGDIAGAEIAQETDGRKLERDVERLMGEAEKDASVDEFDRLRAEFESSQGAHAAAASSGGTDGSGGKTA